jgi:hypothetical protein
MTTTPSWSNLIGKSILAVILFLGAVPLLTNPQPWIFLDGVNFLFHEAGHWLFYFFGPTGSLLGGSLTQLLIPLGLMIYFFRKSQYFAAAFTFYWLGDNLINVGVYMQDAATLSLNIIGGLHDWQTLFSQWGYLSQANHLGGFVRFFGQGCVILGLMLMAVQIIQGFIDKQTSKEYG